MSRSSLRVNKAMLFFCGAMLVAPYFPHAQDMRPVRADKKTIVEHKKKKIHERHVVITHGSDDDKQLRKIKVEKEKEKFKK